jgi:hypothetical protein
MELQVLSAGLIVWTIVILVSFIVLVIYLVDLLKGNFKDDSEKLTWLILIIFIPLVGSLLYLTIGRKQKVRQVDII